MLGDTIKFTITCSQEILVLTIDDLFARLRASTFSTKPEQIKIDETEQAPAEQNNLHRHLLTKVFSQAFLLKPIVPMQVAEMSEFSFASMRGN